MNAMTRRCALLTLILAAVPLGIEGQPPTVEESVDDMVAAWEAGDFQKFADFYHPDTRGFFLDGGLLLRGFNVDALSAAYQQGFRASLEVRELDVQRYGEVAVAVAYMDGTLTLPGGGSIEGTWRYTDTRVLVEGDWQIVQYHFSRQEPLGMR